VTAIQEHQEVDHLEGGPGRGGRHETPKFRTGAAAFTRPDREIGGTASLLVTDATASKQRAQSGHSWLASRKMFVKRSQSMEPETAVVIPPSPEGREKPDLALKGMPL